METNLSINNIADTIGFDQTLPSVVSEYPELPFSLVKLNAKTNIKMSILVCPSSATVSETVR